jgi:hypothetical protein
MNFMLLTVLIGFGIFLGVFTYRSIRWLKRDMAKPGFKSSGFVYTICGHDEGWLNRDPKTDQRILWSVKHQCMYREQGPGSDIWIGSPETMEECIQLGGAYMRAQRELDRVMSKQSA